ncbi:protein Mis18-alpha [Syngnathus scovelli]|uniref:protein Mis18-alpha n=1 Tax=Syngnathus scovelli TaxID=161590 RepID=UPI00211071C8|nr:protein Mis18-alpha [Syngnathus scovelli]
MAARAKQPKDSMKSLNDTFQTFSVDCSDVEEKLLRLSATVTKEEDDDDGPVVFICVKCKLPVGDSLSWDISQDGQTHIQLKRVTNNVLITKETRLHESSKGCLCLIVDLLCVGCRTVLGMIYRSTPKNLDHKRYTFCLNVARIDSYVLGSASQKLSAEGPKEQLVTLEYRSQVEQLLTEMKLMVVSMARHVEELQSAAQDKA